MDGIVNTVINPVKYDWLQREATRNGDLVPMWADLSDNVNPAFRARVADVFGAYYGVDRDVIEWLFDEFLFTTCGCGEEVGDLVGTFLCYLVECDV